MRSQLSTNPLSKLTLTLFALTSLASLAACAKTPDATQFKSVPDDQLDNPSFATSAPPPKTLDKLAPDVQKALDELKAKTKKNLVFVKGGPFIMGAFTELYDGNSGYDDAMHRVILDSFSIQAYKSTAQDIDTYIKATNQHWVVGRLGSRDAGYTMLPNTAAALNWSEAKHYCQWLGNELGLPMDLPTEAQWEYAARSGGKAALYATFDGKLKLGVNIPTDEQRETEQIKDNATQYRPVVGQFEPNRIGLYDMVTDNLEWTNDWYDPKYFKNSPEKNPTGPATGKKKVARGQIAAPKSFLDMNSLTFTRTPTEPNKKDSSDIYGDGYSFETNRKTSARCVVNQNKTIR